LRADSNMTKPELCEGLSASMLVTLTP